MREWTTLVVFLAQAVVACVCFGAAETASGQEAYLLPWEVVSQIVGEGTWFCEKGGLPDGSTRTGIGDPNVRLDPNWCCAYEPLRTITIPAPTSARRFLQKVIDVKLTKWMDGSWRNVGTVKASIEPNSITLACEIENEGFYRLQFEVKILEERLLDYESHVIISTNWKQQILAFCRKLKEEIELERDARLIRSSIASSHFDNVMEAASEASFLSAKILKLLSAAVRSKKAFDAGQFPDLGAGLNRIKLKRFPGGPVAEFNLFIPADYDNSRSRPLFIHIRGEAARSDMIDLEWPSIDLNPFYLSDGRLQWEELTVLLAILKEKLNLDEDRIYVNGECGGGIPAMALALRYPDRFAEASASFGNSYRHLAGNALNLPFVFVRGGGHEAPAMAGYYDFAVKCFQYYGCRNLKCSTTSSTKEARGSPFPQAVRERSPHRVLHTIESLLNPKSYWVRILGREDENICGTIDACVWGQTILVKTKNIDAYRLDLTEAPIDLDRPIEIIENGRSLGSPAGRVFTRRSERYGGVTRVKDERLHGPVSDVFRDPYVVVYGVGGNDAELCEASGEIAKLLARDGPCFADADMPKELVDTHNLVLVGTAQTNSWLAKVAEEVPVQIIDGKVAANGRRYESENAGFFIVYPNPLNPEKYVAVVSATSSFAMAEAAKVCSQISSNLLFSLFSEEEQKYSQVRPVHATDVGIFEVTGEGDIKWHIMEKFSTLWDWHSGWDRVLAVTRKKHAKWRWRQWVAKTLREQLGVDVVICEDPFKFARLEPDLLFTKEQFGANSGICQTPFRFVDIVPEGEVTYRDLWNSFRNDWILRIKLDGESLRNMLTVPFEDIRERRVAAPVIDGVRFAKVEGGGAGTGLGIDELKNDKDYTVACPYKVLNGSRMGIALKDYKIIGEGYVVPLLRDYLAKSENSEIDAQLDNVELNIF